MKLATALLTVGAIGAALLAYWLYEPLPDYVKDRWRLRFRTSMLRVSIALGDTLEYWNMGSFETMSSAVMKLLPPPRDTKSVTFAYHLFANSRTLVVTMPMRQSGAGVVHIHGGGWAMGSPEMYSRVYAELVEKTGVTVFAVRYRLAPEHKFPAAFDDCLAAVEAVFAGAEAFGVDAKRIAIAGDSAGGQLAASVVQALRRRGSQYRPKLQVLVYPATQVVNVHTESYHRRQDTPVMNIILKRSFVSQYLTGSRLAGPWMSRHGHVTQSVRAAYELATGDTLPDVAETSSAAAAASPNLTVATEVASAAIDYRVSPLLGEDLEKLDLPPAHILACEFDPLFDDAVLYARRLEKAGVRALLRHFHTYHSAMDMPADGWELRDYMAHVYRDLL